MKFSLEKNGFFLSRLKFCQRHGDNPILKTFLREEKECVKQSSKCIYYLTKAIDIHHLLCIYYLLHSFYNISTEKVLTTCTHKKKTKIFRTIGKPNSIDVFVRSYIIFSRMKIGKRCFIT